MANDYFPRQRQGLPGTLVGGGDRGVKGRGLQEGTQRTESQRILASTVLLLSWPWASPSTPAPWVPHVHGEEPALE